MDRRCRQLFLAASLVTQYQSQAIDRDVTEIAENIIPNVRQLDRVRSTMRHSLNTLGRTDTAKPEEIEPLRKLARSEFDEMKEALRVYRALPLLPQEADRAASFAEPERRFIEALDSALRRDLSTVNLRSLRNLALEFDDSLTRALDYDTVVGKQLGESITKIRRRSLSQRHLLESRQRDVCDHWNWWSRFMLFEKRFVGPKTESGRTQRTFFGTRSANDLKGPLSSMLLSLDLADRPIADSVRADLRKRMRNAGRLMNGMIDGLLAFARSGAP